MKKAAVIALVLLYALSSSGIGIRQFYCCGKLRTTALNIVPELKKACPDGMNDECCKTKYQFFKVKDSHFSNQEIGGPAKQIAEVPFLPVPNRDHVLPDLSHRNSIFPHAPPYPPCTPSYKMNCVYRI